MPCPFTYRDPDDPDRSTGSSSKDFHCDFRSEALHRQGLLRRGARRLPRAGPTRSSRSKKGPDDMEKFRDFLWSSRTSSTRARQFRNEREGDHARDLQGRAATSACRARSRATTRPARSRSVTKNVGGLRRGPLQTSSRRSSTDNGGRGVRQVLRSAGPTAVAGDREEVDPHRAHGHHHPTAHEQRPSRNTRSTRNPEPQEEKKGGLLGSLQEHHHQVALCPGRFERPVVLHRVRRPEVPRRLQIRRRTPR